ncbi:MAG TPA: tetratricopeptide repeat protein [Pyrinomonadaceae bacterium]|nr:tetratricopeptide repeat protein [Pyrinomonadaceae bacterium]
MLRRLRIISLAVALALGAFAPLAPTVAGQSVASSAQPVAVEQTQKREGNSFLRVLSAPFRAIGKLFRSGKRTTTNGAEEARRKSAQRDAQAVARSAGAVSPEKTLETGAAVAASETARAANVVEPPKTSVGTATGNVEQAARPAAPEAPTRTEMGANIVRPLDGRIVPVEPGMWIPSVEGIAKDPLSQGRALLRQGYLNEAIAELSVASTLGPNLVEANNLLGLALDRRGRHREAREAYERALSLAPNDPQVLNNLGHSHYLDNQFQAALKRLKQAERYAPGAPSVLNNLGLVQARLGKYDEAYRSLARAVGEYDARLRMAEMLEQAGRAADAIKHYEAALRVQPNSSAVLERLAELYERTGRREDAAAARRTLGQPPNKQRTATGGGG